MKNIFNLLVIIVAAFAAAGQIQSQTSTEKINTGQYSLYNTTQVFIKSETVADSFRILISVPDNYFNSDKRYPVIYVLDGDIAFGMMTSIARYLQVGNNIPELIIVGIGYGDSNKDKRGRDYSISKDGGAESFINFLKNELIPYIDAEYRTTPEDRTINGYSLGGTFAMFALFSHPGTFNRYIIGSPYLPAGNFAINNHEERAALKPDELNANVFISVGSEEPDKKYFDPIDKMVTKIQSRNYPGLKLEAKVFDGGTHLICPPEAIAYGLISVFEKQP